jgi:plastocyanin
MTDTTTTTTPGEGEGEPEQPAGVEAPPAAEVEARVAAGEPVPFWHRPYVERYLVPFVLPLVVVVGVVVYVLNVSRLFLSAHGHIPVIIGTVITLLILVGAATLSAAPRMRQTSVILLTAGFLLSLSFAGWISLGHSQEKDTGPAVLAATLKTKETEKIVEAPGGAFAFDPNAVKATTGIAKFEVTAQAPGHTFAFHEANTRFGELKPPPGGPPTVGVAFFPAPGEYHFYCTIQGHEAQGMKGVVTVTGPAVTLEKALVDTGNPAGAAGGG